MMSAGDLGARQQVARQQAAKQQVLYRAAARATLAPSIHNTQPWRFVVGRGRLELFADPSRAVPVVDPDGRQLAISCGAALLGARLSLAAAGFGARVELLPDESAQPELLASLELDDAAPRDPSATRLDRAARSRRSNRREFAEEALPSEVADALHVAAHLEGASLRFVTELDERIAVAMLAQRAADTQTADPAYRAELRAWTTDDPRRTDGVPAVAVPHVASRPDEARDEVPIRGFDTTSSGQLPSQTRSGLHQTLFVVATGADHRRDWLVAGQALYRVLLELTCAGYVASIFSQICEVPSTRHQLRHRLRLSTHPQLMLRAGIAAPTAATPRRPLADVIRMADAATLS
jgi:nitroreductase